MPSVSKQFMIGKLLVQIATSATPTTTLVLVVPNKEPLRLSTDDPV
jgi:hypothetical protein